MGIVSGKYIVFPAYSKLKVRLYHLVHCICMLQLIQANKNPWQPNGLMPIYSDGIARVEVKQGHRYDLKNFCEKRKLNKEDTNVFLECGCFQQDLFNTTGAGRDVILMDVKVNGIA